MKECGIYAIYTIQVVYVQAAFRYRIFLNLIAIIKHFKWNQINTGVNNAI